MTPDFYPGDRGSKPALAGCFYLQVYISPPMHTAFGAWRQDDPSEPKGEAVSTDSEKSLGTSLTNVSL